MKKILVALMTLAAILATNTAWAQGASKKYIPDIVASRVEAVISRVGAVEHDLADAKTEVQALKADLATLKASRSATAGAIRRANEALAAAQAKVAKLEKASAVAQASDAAGQKRLDTLMTGKPAEWNYLLPTEDPLVGLVRQKCPEGSTPEFIVFGANRRFECKPLIKAADLTIPATDSGDSYFTSCLGWAAGGAVLGSAVNYGWGYKQDADSVGWEDAAIGAGVGGGGAYVGCLAYHAIKGK